MFFFFFFSSRRRHTRSYGDWSSDVCSSDLVVLSGLNPAATEPPPVAVCVATETKSATAWISVGLSLPLKDGIPTPRSEERRVGKECRARGGREPEKHTGRESVVTTVINVSL